MQSESGLEAIRRVFENGGFGRGIGATLGITGQYVDSGTVTLVGSPDEDHYNPLGSVHGGYIATMLDGAMALAVQTLVDLGTPYATTDLNISYIRPLTKEVGPVSAVGSVIERTRGRALASAHVRDAKGTLYAHATAGFTISSAAK